MLSERPPENRIDRYAGPYERWVFSKELGRPYSFPLIADGAARYYTALMEGGGEPRGDNRMKVRVPPMWTPSGGALKTIPFAFERTGAAVDPGLREDEQIAQALKAVEEDAAPGPDGFPPRFRVNFPVVESTWVNDYRSGAPAGWQMPSVPPRVIVGVIDDGLPFAHRAFLGPDDRTRISHCWLQAGVAEPAAHVPFGREFVNAEIDELRAACPQDEPALYRAAGVVDSGLFELGDHLRRHATHGAHVLGVAAGNGSLFDAWPQGPEVQIVAVQLPNTIAWDTSGFGKEMYMLAAIHYVFDRARRIAEAAGVDELPCVVNFSYGWSAGRHDGFSAMEAAIEELVTARQAVQPRTIVVMPAGNDFESRMHARIGAADWTSGAARICWQMPPDDATSSYLELWFPPAVDPAGYSVTVTPPPGIALDAPGTLPLTPDPGNEGGDPRRFTELEIGGRIVGQLSADKHRGTRWRVMLALIPTIYTRDQKRVAPAGGWTVTVSRSGTAVPLPDDAEILAWVQRDDDPSDLKSRGRQSYLKMPPSGCPAGPDRDPTRPGNPAQDYAPRLGGIGGYGALNAVSSSPTTRRVGGYVLLTGRPAGYSGAGGLRQLPDDTVEMRGAQVDVAAVSDLSKRRPGTASIGVTSGARARLVGTSGAAPAVTRLMACNVAAGRPFDDGLAGPLALHPAENGDLPSVPGQHAARVGPQTAPQIVKSGETPNR